MTADSFVDIAGRPGSTADPMPEFSADPPQSTPRRDLKAFWRLSEQQIPDNAVTASDLPTKGIPMSKAAPNRANFQALANTVCGHAAAREWPAVTYEAAFISVAHSGTAERTLEGNSMFWDAGWNSQVHNPEHPVSIPRGEQSWRTFLERALYPDLLRADEELKKLGVA